MAVTEEERSGDGEATEKTMAEKDQLARSKKKIRTDASEESANDTEGIGNTHNAKVHSMPMAPGPVKVSYKDKLLKLGPTGFLERVEQGHDVGRGWKEYFAQLNEQGAMQRDKPATDDDEEDMVHTTNSKNPTLYVTTEEYEAWCRPWRNSLIVKLLGQDVSLRFMRLRLERMWVLRDPIRVMNLSNGYFIVSFTNKEDLDYAFQEGPWMIADHYLLVQRWRPNFNPWKADT